MARRFLPHLKGVGCRGGGSFSLRPVYYPFFLSRGLDMTVILSTGPFNLNSSKRVCGGGGGGVGGGWRGGCVRMLARTHVCTCVRPFVSNQIFKRSY